MGRQPNPQPTVKPAQTTQPEVNDSQPNQRVSRFEPDTLLDLALNEIDGYTLVPSSKVANNQTVELVEPRMERDGKVLVKRVAL